MKRTVELGACLVTIAILVSCSGPNSREVHAAYVMTSGGDARAGHDAIRKYGCNACHSSMQRGFVVMGLPTDQFLPANQLFAPQGKVEVKR